MNKVSSQLYEIIIQSHVYNESTEGIEDSQEGINENQLPFECYYCSELYFDNEVFKMHLIECASSNCNKTNCDKEPVLQTPSKIFKCTFKFCNKSFKNTSDFSKHKRIHENDRRHKCIHCPADFVHRTSLRNHLLIHTNEKQFLCCKCGKSFGTCGNFESHSKSCVKDDSEKKHQCEICDKRFVRSSNLIEHIRSHTKEKIKKCLQSGCNKTFTNSSTLAMHTKTHLPQSKRPFFCVICQKRFIQKTHYEKHKLSHTFLENVNASQYQ